MKFKVIPISPDIVKEARRTLVSPQYKSLKAFVDVATGYGPCRSCLRTFKQGEEERLFFTYNAFEGRSDLPDPGPVFVHSAECSGFESAVFPPDLRELPLMFEAFDRSGETLLREKACEELEPQIDALLDTDRVEYLHIRNREAGCFIARIERVSGRDL